MEVTEGDLPNESITPTPYKDRSTGLLVFGIFTVLFGCLCGLFFPLMLIGQLTARAGSPEQPPISAILAAMFAYGVMAVALVWLGIGSIMKRRWARALLLIFSWSWLVMGVIVSVFMIFFMPKMLANIPADPSGQAMPPEAIKVMVVTMVIVFGGIFVLIPGVWTFFYSSRHVKATCEARDPVIRWTDACPLPVLGLSVWMAFSAPMLLVMPILGPVVMPFFGMFLTGLPAVIFCVIMACAWGYASWFLYKLQPQGWWTAVIAVCLVILSSMITFSTRDALEMYHLMGYPESQIAQMEKTGLLTGHRLVWLSSIWLVPLLGYLLFVRKFIFRKSQATDIPLKQL